MTATILAFLIGGLSISASAQDKTSGNPQAQQEVVQKKVNWDKELTKYDKAVDECVKAYKASIEKGSASEKAPSDLPKLLKKAQGMKTTIENSLKELTKEQVDRFNKINEKLEQVVIK